MKIISRKEAKELGLKNYFTGKPCRNGHISIRYINSGGCVECCRKNTALYRINSPEKSKAGVAKWREKNRKEIARKAKIYYEKNKGIILEKAKAKRKENPGGRTAELRAWAKKNPEKVRANKINAEHKRRAQKKSGVTGKQLRQWVSKQIKVCYWCDCDCKESYHIDHYEPLSKGGAHELYNLVIACPTCNKVKKAKDPFEFAAEVGRLF